MQIATFLEAAKDQIIGAAVQFARALPPLHDLDEKVLRDHLPELLEVISADLRTRQSRTESIAKSEGRAPAVDAQTSAQTHGLMRAQIGLSVEQLVAEYRALRSSILRLWGESHAAGPDAIEDIARFNEAIDQAVAESVQVYAHERERWRQIFLGVLGHDLRGPLNALSLTVGALELQPSDSSKRIPILKRSVKRLTALLDSLREYTRSNYGIGMALQRREVDIAQACMEELELLRAANPAALIEFSSNGNTQGDVDSSRVREALGNLVTNAVKHGEQGQPVRVTIYGADGTIRISVENTGEIPSEEIGMLFEPLYQRSTPSERTDRTHLGLGLFIVRQIARAHGGEASGTCVSGHVRFTIELPRSKPAVAARSELGDPTDRPERHLPASA